MKNKLLINGPEMLKYFLSTSLMMLLFINSNGQEIQRFVIGDSGGYDSTSSYTVEWTMGEAITGNITNQEISVSQGFHQGLFYISPVDQQQEIPFNIKCYPNPVVDNLNICIESENHDDTFTLRLEDSQGRRINKTETLPNKVVSFNLTSVQSNCLFLKITGPDKKTYKTFKIVKINPY